jgi:NAD-dependent dihydropyrimidine dehydrogenase PreA subunit
MRVDAMFIGIEVSDEVTGDAALAAKLDEVCPVDIFKGTDAGVQIVAENVDECVLCRLCMDAAPQGAVRVLKLYDSEAVLA